jgi:hypothetical protein
VLLTQRAEDIPFDLKHFPHVVYGGRITELRAEVERRVRWAVENPLAPLTTVEPLLEFFHQGVPLGQEAITVPSQIAEQGIRSTGAHLELSIHNSGRKTYQIDLARIGMLLPSELDQMSVAGRTPVTLPDGSRLFFVDLTRDIFPDAWDRTEIPIFGQVPDSVPMESTLRLRIYSEVTTRDIPFTLRIE